MLVPVADRADRMKKATVSARSNKVVELTIDDDAVMGLAFPIRIKYEVLVAGYGIGVEAKLMTMGGDGAADKKEEEIVLPSRKIKAEEGLVEGTFEVCRPGTLRFEFDNTYSMLRSKSVQYRVEIVSEGEEEEEDGDEAKAADVEFTL